MNERLPKDAKLIDVFDLGDVSTGPKQRFQTSETAQIAGKIRFLLVCPIVFVLLPLFGLASASPPSIGLPTPVSAQGPVCRPATLVQQSSEIEPEDPPEKPDVISDRNRAVEEPNPDPKTPEEPVRRGENLKPQPDLTPTAAEYQMAIYGRPEGAQDFFPEDDCEEAVADLSSTREGHDKLYPYLLYLKQKIRGVWEYPRAAAQAGTGGRLVVGFSIAKNGELLFVNLLDSSGHSILDDSAMNAIRYAGPYMPLPSTLRAKRLRVRANFIYVPSEAFRDALRKDLPTDKRRGPRR